jgi:hypothetical protein
MDSPRALTAADRFEILEQPSGTVSTGTYDDRFERRNGIWKCLERVSNVDRNWPAALFQPWVDREKETFRAS